MEVISKSLLSLLSLLMTLPGPLALSGHGDIQYLVGNLLASFLSVCGLQYLVIDILEPEGQYSQGNLLISRQ